MRLAGQAKGGYYAAPPEAVAMALEYLQPPEGKRYTVFDPCAGEGAAIRQIADALDARAFPCTAYAIELSEDRAEVLKTVLPEGNAIAPASYFGCAISPHFASLIWCNPPFDDRMGGGGRVETDFVYRAIDHLAPHGILALVCPQHVAENYRTMSLLTEQFESDTMCAMPFPDDVRHYDEVIVLCRKLDVPGRDQWCNMNNQYAQAARRRVIHELPPGRRPIRFAKCELTEDEVIRALKDSPLRRVLAVPREQPLPRPPMSPGQGHRAMLLASGFIDGLVEPEGEPPHVVRGTCRKKQYVAEQSVTENLDGSVTSKTVTAEKMQLVVRALDHGGTIHTLLQE